jgi:hypothetical protein
MAECVSITELLRRKLVSEGISPEEVVGFFYDWKKEGLSGENLYYYFGKDGFFENPKRAGRRVLRHVHLPPEYGGKEHELWEKNHKNKSRKTSDNYLIYAHDPLHGFLLIDITREPNSHRIARMADHESKAYMEELATVAEKFIFNGKIVI